VLLSNNDTPELAPNVLYLKKISHNEIEAYTYEKGMRKLNANEVNALHIILDKTPDESFPDAGKDSIEIVLAENKKLIKKIELACGFSRDKNIVKVAARASDGTIESTEIYDHIRTYQHHHEYYQHEIKPEGKIAQAVLKEAFMDLVEEHCAEKLRTGIGNRKQ
jgi:hypothetical protein